MFKRYLTYLIFLTVQLSFFSNKTYATHIVGGDFKITMTNHTGSGASYVFQLRLYRDDVNGSPLATMPNSATIGIYDAVTHAQISTVDLSRNSLGFVNLGDPCYSPDPNVISIEEGVFTNTTPKYVPNNSNGYYIQYQAYARNGVVINMLDPDSKGITIFAMFPDPALGQNSSPDFGVYPNDAYFCANNTKLINFPITDPDGDVLVYSLVNPLNSVGNSNGTQAGSGSNPQNFYPSCPWAAGYSLNNIIGGNPTMSINSSTGEISATPSLLGYFAFAIRVEEYRNGVKIGEVRRDVQYKSEPCVTANPPALSLNNNIAVPSQLNNNIDSVSVGVYVDDSICLDLEIGVNDPADSLYAMLTSSDFDLLNNYIPPSPFNLSTTTSNCSYTFNMLDSYGDGWNGASVDISINGTVVYPGVGSSFSTGNTSTFTLNVSSGDVITIPSGNWTSGTFDSEIDWEILDNNGSVVAAGCHPSYFLCSYNAPNVVVSCPSSSTGTTHAYFNWNNTSDTSFFNLSNLTPSGFLGNVGNINLRYCWMPPCNYLGDTLQLDLDAYSIDCSGFNPIEADIYVHIDPIPQETTFDYEPLTSITLDTSLCIYVFAEDSVNNDDTLFIQPLASNFDFSTSFVPPTWDQNNDVYYYEDFNDSIGYTVTMNNYYNNTSSNVVSALSNVALKYCWTVDCDFIALNEYQLQYEVMSSLCGAVPDTIMSLINVERSSSPIQSIPNVFTPNNDGWNDYYKMAGEGYSCTDSLTIQIFNRWGKLVFESDDPYFEWDGKDLNGDDCVEGPYLTLISPAGNGGFYGSTMQNNNPVPEPRQYRNWIQLIR